MREDQTTLVSLKSSAFPYFGKNLGYHGWMIMMRLLVGLLAIEWVAARLPTC